jgi:hypothetical protein
MRRLVVPALIACSVGLICTPLQAQPRERDRPQRPAAPAQPATPAEPAAPARPQQRQERPGQPGDPMDAERAAGAPGASHAHFDPLVGRWEAQITTWFGPDAEPSTTTGMARYEWVLRDADSERGRFLRQDFHAEMMGMSFRGLGYWGHDNIRKEYTSLWMDNMSTSMTSGTGSYDPAARAFTYKSSVLGPDGLERQTRMVITIQGDDRHTFEYFQAMARQPEAKAMEIIYTRVRGPSDEERLRDRFRRDGERPGMRPGGSEPGGERPPRRDP